MKKVRVDALRKAQGAFVILHEHEWAVLEPMALWVTRLFLAIVRFSDFKTGAGECSYAQLVAACQPIQPRSGPRLYTPDVQAVKKEVRRLELRRVIARDDAHSQASQSLFFAVIPRVPQLAQRRNSNPKLEPQPTGREASNGAGFDDADLRTRTPNSNPSSTASFIHKGEGDLSTCGQVSTAREALAEVRESLAARGRSRAPKGA